MPFTAKIFQVLVASPSDVRGEREEVQKVIHHWNSVNGMNFKIFLQPVLWEKDSLPEVGDRPQELLNKQIVRDSDLLVATFWTRLGTPTGKAESGTIEEIQEFREAKKPILLYFSGQPVAPNSIDQEQFEQLTIFKKTAQKDGLYYEYNSIEEFSTCLFSHLTKIASRWKKDFSEECIFEKSNPHLKEQYISTIESYSVDWKKEKSNMSYDISSSQYLFKDIFKYLKNFISSYHSHLDQDIIVSLNNNANMCNKISEMKLYPDGGKSFENFWKLGDGLFNNLHKMSEKI